MSRRTTASCALVALTLVGGPSASADEPADRDATRDDLAALVDKPTPQHQILAQEEGVWGATITSYLEGPDARPEVSKGVETNRLMTGGLWRLSDFQGEFSGEPFHGRGTFGYDPKKGKYVGTWVDSMTARLTILEGTYDQEAKALTLLAESADLTTDKPMKEKHVTQYRDQNTRVYTMYVQTEETEGSFIKVMEISSTRRPK